MILPLELMRMIIDYIPEHKKATLAVIAQCSKVLDKRRQEWPRVDDADSVGRDTLNICDQVV